MKFTDKAVALSTLHVYLRRDSIVKYVACMQTAKQAELRNDGSLFIVGGSVLEGDRRRGGTADSKRSAQEPQAQKYFCATVPRTSRSSGRAAALGQHDERDDHARRAAAFVSCFAFAPRLVRYGVLIGVLSALGPYTQGPVHPM